MAVMLCMGMPPKVSKEKAVRLPLLPALLPTRGIHAAPLWANPNKTYGAQRGKRE